MTKTKVKVAVVQQSPVFLDREQTLRRTASAIEKAAGRGANLIVFSEAYIPGYPVWVWRLRPGGDFKQSETLHARLLENAVDIDAGDLSPLMEAARTCEVTLVLGVVERDSELSRSTLYNTAVTIGPDGKLLNRHRKLMPTNPERMVWGFGDASGLRVVDTTVGRIGVLLCWESYMPLARYAMYSQGVDIYIAPTYDSGDKWLGTLQHIAREGGCWVVGSGYAFTGDDIPEGFPEREALFPEGNDWINQGDSVVIAPGGDIVAGPMRNEQGTLNAEIDFGKIGPARRSLDVAGHYARPDIFQLRVNTRRQTPALFSDEE